jgi:ankyrin repeat protein
VWAVAVLLALLAGTFALSRMQAIAAERAILTRALIAAVQNRNAAEAERLLEAGADANAKIGNEMASDLWSSVIRLLRLPSAPRDGDPLILDAVDRSDRDVMRALLAHGADPNGGTAWGGPLHRALFRSDYEAARLLLEGGADPDLGRVGGVSLLMEAATRKDAKAALLLLDHRANPRLRDSSGATALDRAKKSGSEEVVRLLREHGVK